MVNLGSGNRERDLPVQASPVRAKRIARGRQPRIPGTARSPTLNAVGYDGAPFRWDDARRFLLRSELDALFFHLYGIARDDADYIMDTLPIVRRKDEQQFGEYRTKRMILEIYDAMAEAGRTGVPYQTRLDPPPADPRLAHPINPSGEA